MPKIIQMLRTGYRKHHIVNTRRWESGARHKGRSQKAIHSLSRALAGRFQFRRWPWARLERVCESEAKLRLDTSTHFSPKFQKTK